MTDLQNISFIKNSSLLKARQEFMDINVFSALVLESWRYSLHSYEWLDKQGKLKSPGKLPEAQHEKRLAIEKQIAAGESIEKSILGIGIYDNVEIGSRKVEFLTLTAMGMEIIPVHIPKSCQGDFQPYLAPLSSS